MKSGCVGVDSDRFGCFHRSVGMSGDGSLLTHTCFLEKVQDLFQKIVSSPKYPSYPSPVTMDVISDRIGVSYGYYE